MSWFGKKPRVEVLTTVASDKLPWGTEAALILVTHGKGTLRWEQRKRSGAGATVQLMLGDVPLLLSKSEAEYCPTCEHLLALGLGYEEVDQRLVALVSEASNRSSESPLRLVESISPLLKTLETGLYLISVVPHSPTDGKGRPFWKLRRKFSRYEASRHMHCVEMDLPEYVSGFPAFLAPTQAMHHLDWPAVERYRRKIRSGESVGGLAYWGEGFVSALLDGHHRATACLLEGVDLPCVTVMGDPYLEFADEGKYLRFWDARVRVESLPAKAQLVFEQALSPKEAGRPATGLELPSEGELPQLDERLNKAAQSFATVDGLAARLVAGDLSDEGLARLLKERESAKISVARRALVAMRDARSLDFALRIAEQGYPDLMRETFTFLAGVPGERVDDFFVSFLVEDDKSHPWLTEIVTNYFRERDGA